MEHTVTGCHDCPFLNLHKDWCAHPEIDADVEDYQIYSNYESYPIVPITPDWCPLKQDPITIIMAANLQQSQINKT